jgi:hypothetical protein
MSEVIVVTPDPAPEPEPVPINVVVEVIAPESEPVPVVLAPPVDPHADAIAELKAECAAAHARCAALEGLLQEAEEEEPVAPPMAIEIGGPIVAEEPPFDMWKHMGTIL